MVETAGNDAFGKTAIACLYLLREPLSRLGLFKRTVKNKTSAVR